MRSDAFAPQNMCKSYQNQATIAAFIAWRDL